MFDVLFNVKQNAMNVSFFLFFQEPVGEGDSIFRS